MKHSFILLLSMLPWMAAAQIEKGKIFTTAAIRYNLNKQEALSAGQNSDFRTNNFFFNGSTCYFITPRIAAGLDLQLSSTIQKSSPSGGRTTNSSVSTGILGRWYNRCQANFFFSFRGVPVLASERIRPSTIPIPLLKVLVPAGLSASDCSLV